MCKFAIKMHGLAKQNISILKHLVKCQYSTSTLILDSLIGENYMLSATLFERDPCCYFLCENTQNHYCGFFMSVTIRNHGGTPCLTQLLQSIILCSDNLLILIALQWILIHYYIRSAVQVTVYFHNSKMSEDLLVHAIVACGNHCEHTLCWNWKFI